MQRVFERDNSGFGTTIPQVESSLQMEATTTVTLITAVTVTIWGSFPVELTVNPYVGADVAFKSGVDYKCNNLVQYALFYGLDATASLLPFIFPTVLPFIGGSETTLGGYLPYSVSYSVISKTYATCSKCSGCIDFRSVANADSEIGFTEAKQNFSSFDTKTAIPIAEKPFTLQVTIHSGSFSTCNKYYYIYSPLLGQQTPSILSCTPSWTTSNTFTISNFKLGVSSLRVCFQYSKITNY